MGNESQCNLRSETWRPRFVSFLPPLILSFLWAHLSIYIHSTVCSGAIRASALLLCWATLPPTALLSHSDHNPTCQAILSPPLLHSLHFIGRTGHLYLPVRQDQSIGHPHSTSPKPTDPAPTFHTLLFLPTAVVFGTVLQQYWLGKTCISNITITGYDISCSTCIMTIIHWYRHLRIIINFIAAGRMHTWPTGYNPLHTFKCSESKMWLWTGIYTTLRL